MKKYKVIVNGVEYEVQVELLGDDYVPEKKEEPAAPVKNAPADNAAGAVKAPLTGTITSVNIKAGDAVKKGQVLMILEAMKMENEILATSDCTVKEVFVHAGKQVEATDTLCVTG